MLKGRNKRLLKEAITRGDFELTSLPRQKEPYTFIELWVELPTQAKEGSTEFTGYGFAKKLPTDEWDTTLGLEIAQDRAALHIIEQWCEYVSVRMFKAVMEPLWAEDKAKKEEKKRRKEERCKES